VLGLEFASISEIRVKPSLQDPCLSVCIRG
jgi:hypothetical protein